MELRLGAGGRWQELGVLASGATAPSAERASVSGYRTRVDERTRTNHTQMKCLVNFILYDLVNVNVSHVGELTIYYISYADKIIVFYVLGANQGAHNTRRVRACRVRVYGLRDRPTRGTRRGCRDNLSSGPAQSCQDLLHYSKPKREPASEERYN